MPKVVVLGSSGYDLSVRLPRLPRPGETILGGRLGTGPGGKGANQAIAARRAGADVNFLTAFGDDEFGRLAAENCRSEGLDLSHARIVPGTPNQVALIFVGEDGENLIGVAPGASDSLSAADMEDLPEDVFSAPGVFLASLEVPLEAVIRGLQRARRAGMTTVVNPAPSSALVMATGFADLVDVITPNEEEAASLADREDRGPADAGRSARILRDMGFRSVIVTLGGAGCLVLSEMTGERRIAAPEVEVIDTVGAGDAFSGALAVALADGLDLVTAARWACAAGAFAVTRPGAQGALPSRREIERLLGAQPYSV